MTGDRVEAEVDALRARLDEAEETLRAIRSGEVDALIVAGEEGERVYTLQGAEHPYREMIETMGQGAAFLGPDGTVLYCNRRFAELMDRPPERVVGATAASLLPVSERPALEALLARGRTSAGQEEIALRAADGSAIPAYLAVSPLREAEATCLIVTDLTERKRRQDLQEINRRKDEFLAMLAHELRNPLAPIRNALYLLKPGAADAPPPDEVREMMERQVEHLARLIDDLMDVSRISAGKIELRPDVVDLAEIALRAVETCRPLIDSRGHALTVTLPTSPVRLEADPTRLEQVFDNLLTNAAKYSDPGGRIHLHACREGDWAVVKIADTGIGIDPGKIPHIFDLFVQVERRLDRSQGGIGIGLNLVRSLVDMHGGIVEVASPGLGLGSEFVVRLPALAEGVEIGPDPGPALSADGRGGSGAALPRRRVLVVDDNEDSARTMAMVLGRVWGQEVAVVHDGRAAIEATLAFRPEVILLDIGLPGMSGYEVAASIRVDPPDDDPVPLLVAMTGWGQEDDLRRSREAGFDHHLVKPVDLDTLRTILASPRPARGPTSTSHPEAGPRDGKRDDPGPPSPLDLGPA